MQKMPNLNIKNGQKCVLSLRTLMHQKLILFTKCKYLFRIISEYGGRGALLLPLHCVKVEEEDVD